MEEGLLGSLFGDGDEGGDWAPFSGTLTSDTGPVVSGRRSRAPRPEPERNATGFAGLLNQGATCYLNSLLQTLCMAIMRIFSITPDNLGFNPENLHDIYFGKLGTAVNLGTAKSEMGAKADTPATDATASSKGETQASSSAARTAGGAKAKAVPVVVEPDPAHLVALCSMGFAEDIVRAGLIKFKNDADLTTNWLLDNPTWEEEKPSAPKDPAAVVDEITDEVPFKLEASPGPSLTPAVAYVPASAIEMPKAPTAEQVGEIDVFSLLGEDAFPDAEALSTMAPAIEHSKPLKKPAVSVAAPVVLPTPAADGKLTATPAAAAAPAQRSTGKMIALELQRLFANMQLANRQAISTERLTRSFGWIGRDTSVQHDVHELIRVLFDIIDRALKGTPGESLIPSLYKGTIVNKIICLTCGRTSERVEDLLDVGLIVKGFRDVTESLAALTTFETLSGDNQYHCERCAKKVDALKGMKLRTVPPLLIVPLMRFEYDVNQEARVKNSGSFPFPLILDLAPYCENATTAAPTTDALQAALAGVIPSAPVPEGKDKKRVPIGEEFLEIGPEDSASPMLYDLFSVVIHRGSQAGFGHYHALIRDICPGEKRERASRDDKDELPFDPALARFGRWYDFDDSRVTEVPVAAIAKQYGGRTECGYMLVYRRRSQECSATEKDLAAPTTFHAEIAEGNSAVSDERKQYDESLHFADVVICIGPHFKLEQGGLHDRGARDAEPANAPLTKVMFNVDIRMKQLKERVKDFFGEALPDVAHIQLHDLQTRAGRVHINKVIGPDEITVGDAGINKDHVRLLAWDGKTIGAVEYRQEGTRTSHFSNSQDRVTVAPFAAEITFKVKYFMAEDDISEFDVSTNEAAALSEIQTQLQDITGIPPEHQYVCKLGWKEAQHLRDVKQTAFELALFDGCVVSLERCEDINSKAFKSLAAISVKQNTNTIEVYAIDHVSGAEPPPNITVHIQKDAPLVELKREILKHLPANKVVPLEECRLRRYQLGGAIGSVYGDELLPLQQSGITANMCIIIDKGPAPSMAKVKLQFIVVSDGKRVDTYVIDVERTWTIAKCKETMCEEVKKSPQNFRVRRTDLWGHPDRLFDDEALTVDRAKGIEFMLWLEEGKPPVKGQINVAVTMLAYSESDAAQCAGSKMAWITSPAVRMVSLAFPGDTEDGWTLTPVFDLDFSCLSTLGELKAAILQHGSLKHITSPKLMRVWARDRLLKRDSHTLKKQNVSCDSALTVQVLPEEEGEFEASDTLLYIHKRVSLTLSFGPPMEIRFKGTTFAELQQAVSKLLDVPAVSLLLAKLNPHSGKWAVLELETAETGKKPKTKFHVKDGDVIVAKDAREDVGNDDDFTNLILQDAYTRRKESQKGPAGPRPKGRARAPEIALRIDVD